MLIVIIYEVLSIGGVSLYLYMKGKKLAAEGGEGSGAFANAGRSLPWPVVGASIALAVLGAVHVFGIMEVSWNMGAISVWFSIAHVVLICVICLVTGRFVRRLKVNTIPELIRMLFDDRVALLCVAVIAAQTFAILTMEVQALGIIFNGLTQNAVTTEVGTIIGAAFGLAYVLLAGMKEIGWVNMINTVVMYAGLILATAFLAQYLFTGNPYDGYSGWDAVGAFFANPPAGVEQPGPVPIEAYPSIFGTGGMGGSLVTFGIATVVAVTFAQGISQMGLQSTMAAKDEKTVVKSLWVAAPVNGLFGIFTALIGIAAFAAVNSGNLNLPANAIPAKQAGLALLLDILPAWVVGILVAAFLGAVLSTFAITTLSLGNIFVNDIYLRRHPDASEATKTKYTRIFIVLAAVVAVLATLNKPEIVNGANWAFAWLAPIFWNVIFALFWKRNGKAAMIVFVVSWICVILWTYTPFRLAIGAIPIPYLTLAISVVLGAILTAVLPGSKPGYFKELEQRKAKAAEAAR
jgi:SSS family solute:Na+ symporter